MFEKNRAIFIAISKELNAEIPEGREKEQMHTALQQALMWANAAVALASPLEGE